MPDSQNGSQETRVYSDPAAAALGERVSNLSRRQTDLENEMRAGFRSMEGHIDRIATDTRNALSSLTQNLSERNKPQWQALSVMLAALIAIGGLVFWPIREGQGRIDTALARISEVMVTRQEMDWRSQRTAEDRARTETALLDLRTAMLPRNEWQERNLARDHDIDNIRRSIESDVENLQRQLDLQRSDFSSFSSSLGNGRDVIQDLKSELDRLRNQLTEIRSQQYERTGAAGP